ncbi:MAG: CPBP family intramembrane metalloprotease [Myxococcales bacterium]|nr:CPBP family intramembrane metalloprotease [Myxococcales bacterium]
MASDLDRQRDWIILGATVLFAAGLGVGAVWNTWIPILIVAVLCLVWVGRSRVRPDIDLSLRSVAYGLGSGLALVALTHAGFSVAVRVFPSVLDSAELLYARLEDPPGPLVSIPILLLAIAAEEFVWRGVVYQRLRSKLAPIPTMATGTLLYALPQFGSGTWELPVLALAMGGVWMGLRHATKGLTVPTINHAVWTVCIMALLPLI